MNELFNETIQSLINENGERNTDIEMCIENKGASNLRSVPNSDDQSEMARWNRVLLRAENEFAILYAKYYGDDYGVKALINIKTNKFLRPFLPLDDPNNILLKSFCAVSHYLDWNGTSDHVLFSDLQNKYGIALRVSRSLLSTRFSDAIPTRKALQTIAMHVRIYRQISIFDMNCKGAFWSSLLTQNYQLYIIPVDRPGKSNEVNHACIVRQRSAEFLRLNQKEAANSALMLCCPEKESDVPQIIKAYSGKLIFFIGNTDMAIQKTTFNVRKYMQILADMLAADSEQSRGWTSWKCITQVDLPHWPNSEMELTVWLRTPEMKPKTSGISRLRRKGNLKIFESSDEEGAEKI